MTASAEASIEVEPGSPPPTPPSRSHSPSSIEPQRPSPRLEAEQPLDGKGTEEAFGAVEEVVPKARREREHGARMREEDEGIELPKSESLKEGRGATLQELGRSGVEKARM